jgi:ectoine hydroxylase-related dioxygenase (phytanoyl-CoA dioxygenase family)
MALTQQQIRAYRADGFLAPIPVLNDREAAEVRAQFDALEAVEGREKAQIGLLDRHFDQGFIRQLATHPTILDCAEALLGPDILLLATHFFCKYGGGERFVAWHQDATYWGLEPPITLTAWYAVDASDRENGCMQALPGTHRDGLRAHGKSGVAGNLLSINQEVPVTEDELRSVVDLELRAGEISLHDGWLIHGSLPNRSDRRRCGLTLRYVPASVRPVAVNSMSKTWNAVVVRGQGNEANWNTVSTRNAYRSEVGVQSKVVA